MINSNFISTENFLCLLEALITLHHNIDSVYKDKNECQKLKANLEKKYAMHFNEYKHQVYSANTKVKVLE